MQAPPGARHLLVLPQLLLQQLRQLIKEQARGSARTAFSQTEDTPTCFSSDRLARASLWSCPRPSTCPSPSSRLQLLQR